MTWMTTRCREMTTENPWRGIALPSIAHSVNARRVAAELPWHFFWARGADRGILLTLRHARESAPDAPLPKLRDIEVTLSRPDETNTQFLAFRLLDMDQQDIFHALCLDIISAASRAETEVEAVSIALMRTWRWHHLLRGGSGAGLSPEEQMGLLGELLVLERLLLPHMGASNAVAAWRGPLGYPKDFEIGRVAIEAKARRGGLSPFVTITSEDQLDPSGLDALFLHVVEVNPAPSDAIDGSTIVEVAERVRSQLFSLDPGAATAFVNLLSAAGLRPEDDYSNTPWLEGDSSLYSVSNQFPRIARSELRSGVSRVRYALSLSDCEPFVTPVSNLSETLADIGGSHGD